MLFLDSAPDITPITNLITTWIHTGRAWSDRLVRSRSSLRCCACHKRCRLVFGLSASQGFGHVDVDRDITELLVHRPRRGVVTENVQLDAVEPHGPGFLFEPGHRLRRVAVPAKRFIDLDVEDERMAGRGRSGVGPEQADLLPIA